MRARRWVIGTAATLAIGVGGAAPAFAATRFAVASGGDNTTSDCKETTNNPACTIARAFGQAQAGDTVSIGAGTYHPPATIDVTQKLTIVATDTAGARPELDGADVPLDLDAGSDGSTVTHVAFSVTGENADGVEVREAATFTDDAISSSNTCLNVFTTTQVVTLVDDTLTEAADPGATCVDASSEGPLSISGSTISAPGNTALVLGSGSVTDSTLTGAVTLDGGSITNSTLTGAFPALALKGPDTVGRRDTISGTTEGVELAHGALLADSVVTSATFAAVDSTSAGTAENVTAIGIAPGAIGFESDAGSELTVRNSIARGSGDDLEANPAPMPCSPCVPGLIHVDHSDYATSSGTIDTSGGGNITADPAFVSATDFDLQASSPAIDAGVVTANTGTVDRDGKTRVIGPGLDMGAYEFQGGAPVVSTGPVTEIGTTSVTVTGTVKAAEEPTAAMFDYGPTTSYGKTADTTALPTGDDAHALSVKLTGLQPGHTYHVQLSASNSLGVANGVDIVFMTTPVPVPKLSHVKFTPASFHVTSKHRAATHIHFKLSEVATVRITLARHRALTLRGLKAGSHSIKFSGHVAKHVLKPGKYRATLVARAIGAPRPSRPVHAKFRIVRSG